MKDNDPYLSATVPLSSEAVRGYMLSSKEQNKIFQYIYFGLELQSTTDENQKKGLQTKMDRAVRALRKRPKDKNAIEALLRKTNALLKRGVKRQ